MFLQVRPLDGTFPDDYLVTDPSAVRGVIYMDREEIEVGRFAAARARFRSGGSVPNSGVEYAVRNGDNVLRVYVSEPTPDVEADFHTMIQSLRW